MKKRKPTKQAVKKGNVLRQNVKNEFVVGEYNLKNVGVFDGLLLYKQAILYVCSWAVTIVLLCQIRALRADSSAQAVDVSPSFKFYKKLVTGKIGQAVGTLTVAYDAILYLEQEPKKLNEQLVDLLDNNTGTSKHIEKVTKDNWSLYILGGVARFIGLGNSCPCSNYKVFGIENPLGLNIQNILDYIEVPNKPTVEDVKLFLQNQFYAVDNGERKQINFDENEIGDKGYAPLELEIFGPDKTPMRQISLKTRSATLGADGAIPGNAISKVDLETYLTPLERVRYEQAAKAGMKKMLQDLNKKVIDKIKAAELKEITEITEEEIKVESTSTDMDTINVENISSESQEISSNITDLIGGYTDSNNNQDSKNNLNSENPSKSENSQILLVKQPILPLNNQKPLGQSGNNTSQSTPGGRSKNSHKNPNWRKQ
jgi:hypothetical protein